MPRLSLRAGLKMVAEIVETQLKNDLWTLWCNAYPHMTDKTFVSYEDFCNRHMTKKTKLSQVDGDKLIESANGILRRLQDKK